ncbi:hypothetical protein SAMN05421664_2496 [Chryseobacterium soldanellicola]|uniref:Heme oxygenase n=1 Tax=Chryseobacterium soldanellicola TaxID=311333 RepID=A0A1H1DIA4_9FLAO|nr:hypothetical protein [Chryseobacterium soldanellicola]SDQ76234.1 hypothetical protein SAMN05421664_2496 [Chryseobacterium soldanellicola]
MKTIRLYKFKDIISKKIPLFSKESSLNTLNELIYTELMDVEIVTEYIINTSNDFIFEEVSKSELLQLCSIAKETIEHYFVTTNNDYDLI